MDILGLTGCTEIEIGADSALESVASDWTGVTAVADHVEMDIFALRNADLDQGVMSRMGILGLTSST